MKGQRYSQEELLSDPEWAVIYVGHVVETRPGGPRSALQLSNPLTPFVGADPRLISPVNSRNEIFLPLGCDSISLKVGEGSTLSGGVMGHVNLGTMEKVARAFIEEYIKSGEDFRRALEAAKREYSEVKITGDNGVILSREEIISNLMRMIR